MKIVSISSNNLDCKRKQNLSFEGGLGSKVYSKLAKSGVGMLDLAAEAERISSINHPNIAIVDAVYNFQEKVGKFFFSLTHKNYLDSLEDIEPGVAIVKGEDNLWDALKKLDKKAIVSGNNEFILRYKKMDEIRKIKMQEMQERQKAFNEKLRKDFEEDNSFWPKYYRDLAKSRETQQINVAK